MCAALGASDVQSDLGSNGGDKLFQQGKYKVLLTLVAGAMNTNGLFHGVLVAKITKFTPLFLFPFWFSGAGNDNGSAVRRGVLRWNRHGP